MFNILFKIFDLLVQEQWEKLQSKSMRRKGTRNLFFGILIQDESKPKLGKFNVRDA